MCDFVVVQFDMYKKHEDEQFKDRKSVQSEDDKDCRVHVCLYFMSGPRIQNVDIEVMGQLQEYLSIIPILAKGDCYTTEEIVIMKS